MIMLEIKAYAHIADDLPHDRLCRCYHRKPANRMEAMLGWSLIRLSESVNLCGNVIKKGSWLVQQNWINRPTQASLLSFNQARRDFYIPKNRVLTPHPQENK